MTDELYGTFTVEVYIAGSHDDGKAEVEVDDWLAEMDVIEDALKDIAKDWEARLNGRWPGSKINILATS